MAGDQQSTNQSDEGISGRLNVLMLSPSFNDHIDWESDLVDVSLYVELPYWLMVERCSLVVEHSDHKFHVDIHDEDFEVFGGKFTDSRVTCVHRGPMTADGWSPSGEIAKLVNHNGLPLIERHCKTVLRFHAKALRSTFDAIPESAIPAARNARDAYFSALCEGHMPVLNEVIQRYRLVTYDHFAYELSAWDVPIWYARMETNGVRVMLHPYREWDVKPRLIGLDRQMIVMSYSNGDELQGASSSTSVPGEFDLLDARSLIERGNYTDALRRVFTAIEALVGWALRGELLKLHDETVVEAKLAASKNNAPGRLRQLAKLRGKGRIPGSLVDDFEKVRDIRNDIVHRSRRITHNERNLALRCVEIGVWLFNKIEEEPVREKIRNGDVPRSVGRASLAARFPTSITETGVIVDPFIANLRT